MAAWGAYDYSEDIDSKLILPAFIRLRKPPMALCMKNTKWKTTSQMSTRKQKAD